MCNRNTAASSAASDPRCSENPCNVLANHRNRCFTKHMVSEKLQVLIFKKQSKSYRHALREEIGQHRTRNARVAVEMQSMSMVQMFCHKINH